MKKLLVTRVSNRGPHPCLPLSSHITQPSFILFAPRAKAQDSMVEQWLELPPHNKKAAASNQAYVKFMFSLSMHGFPPTDQTYMWYL